MKMSRALIVAAGFAACVSPALAQWSEDPSMHVSVADGAGEQVQPKIVATADGGCYISWYSSQTGYDVRLQRLDADGVEQWAHNGVLVADRNFSSTQDYDLDVDSSGHAVLAFRDDRFGGTLVTAQRVAPDGSFTWGANGIQFGNGTDFVGSPDIAATSDGDTVVAWTNNSDTKLARISAAGMVEWESTIAGNGTGINLASMHGSDNGSVIVSWVQFAVFFDPKHLYAQKIDDMGDEAWASRVAVFDGGSLQFGNFPEFETDDSGGAVFSWYDTANSLNVYVQRLGSDGSELYPHNGIAASTNGRERVSPNATYDAQSDSVVVAWTELDNNQGSQGIFAQRIDSTGARQWGSDGVEISSIDALESLWAQPRALNDAIVIAWIEGAGGGDQVLAHGLERDGSDAWSSSTVVATSASLDRTRLVSANGADGDVLAAWQSGPFGSADIEAHNVNADGSLGNQDGCRADLTMDGELDFFDVSAFLQALANENPIADFSGDGEYDFFDVSAFLQELQAGCP
jgi:hypothetical protein